MVAEMIRKHRVMVAGVVLLGAAAVAVAATSAAGFLSLDENESGLGSGASASGYIDIAANAPLAGGTATSGSGFSSYSGPVGPVSAGSTTIQDWNTFAD